MLCVTCASHAMLCGYVCSNCPMPMPIKMQTRVPPFPRLHISLHQYTCKHTHTHTYTHTYTPGTRTRTHTQEHKQEHSCIHTQEHTHNTHAYIHIHTRTHAHTGAHTLSGCALEPRALDELLPDWKSDPDVPIKV